jgi:hypothetical protein
MSRPSFEIKRVLFQFPIKVKAGSLGSLGTLAKMLAYGPRPNNDRSLGQAHASSTGRRASACALVVLLLDALCSFARRARRRALPSAETVGEWLRRAASREGAGRARLCYSTLEALTGCGLRSAAVLNYRRFFLAGADCR